MQRFQWRPTAGAVDHPLMLDPDIRLMSFSRGDAYTSRLHFLSLLRLPEGAYNLTYNLPENDIYLLAPTAQLVVRNDFHPALIDLLLNAAREVGSPAGVFERREDFPAPRFLDFPLSSEAERYYKRGPHLLQRVFPFWLANLAIRMKIMLLPLLALLLPLIKLLPAFLQLADAVPDLPVVRSADGYRLRDTEQRWASSQG
jgi:hypothetical protein